MLPIRVSADRIGVGSNRRPPARPGARGAEPLAVGIAAADAMTAGADDARAQRQRSESQPIEP